MATAPLKVFTKTYGSSSGKGIIIDPRSIYRRKTALPTTWKRIRIGMIFGYTNTTDNNGAVTGETLYDGTGAPYGRFHFGMIDDTLDSMPGYGTCKYVGVDSGATLYQKVNGAFSDNSGTTTCGLNCFISNGTNVSRTGSMSPDLLINDTTAAVNFCTGLVAEIQPNGTGVILISVGSYKNISDTSELKMSQMLASGTGTTSNMSTTLSTGNWFDTTTSNPIGLTTLFIHHPMATSRMIIYNMGVMQLE